MGLPGLPPWFFEPKGRYDEHVFESQVRKGNPLGDPHHRPLWVYLPPGYDADPQGRYPSIYLIMGLTGQIDMWRNRAPFRRNFPELADAQFAAGGAPPCILIYVDCWTSLGGSQYVDSPGTGKSSCGYGAMITPMLRPDLFGAWRPTPVARSSRCRTRTNFRSRFERCATSITAPSMSSGRTSPKTAMVGCSDSDGASPCRCAAKDAGDLHRCRQT